MWEGGGKGGIKGQVRNKVVVSLCSKFLTFEKNFIQRLFDMLAQGGGR